jgi:hypothetical protein
LHRTDRARYRSEIAVTYTPVVTIDLVGAHQCAGIGIGYGNGLIIVTGASDPESVVFTVPTGPIDLNGGLGGGDKDRRQGKRQDSKGCYYEWIFQKTHAFILLVLSVFYY